MTLWQVQMYLEALWGTNAHLTWWENSLYAGAFNASILLGHADLAVEFTDLSHFENPITAWQWDFDNDGNIDSEEQNPSWIYTSCPEFIP